MIDNKMWIIFNETQNSVYCDEALFARFNWKKSNHFIKARLYMDQTKALDDLEWIHTIQREGGDGVQLIFPNDEIVIKEFSLN